MNLIQETLEGLENFPDSQEIVVTAPVLKSIGMTYKDLPENRMVATTVGELRRLAESIPKETKETKNENKLPRRKGS